LKFNLTHTELNAKAKHPHHTTNAYQLFIHQFLPSTFVNKCVMCWKSKRIL